MLRSARMVVGLCLFGGVSLAAVIGWATGFFGRAAAFVSGLWQGFTAWLDQPLGLDHLFAGIGVLVIPAIIIMVIFAIADS